MALGSGLTCCKVDAPIVEADSHVKQKIVNPGKIKIKKSCELAAFKHHIVAKQVGMNRAAGQGGVQAAAGDMVLIGQLALDELALACRQVRHHDRNRLVPPRQGAQIGLQARVILPSQMHARQHAPDGGAMCRRRRKLAHAAQAVDDAGRFALNSLQHIAAFVRPWVWHRNAALRQMLHQVQIKRQLSMR